MEKSILTLLFGLLATGAFAQTTQGNLVVSGQISISNDKSEANETYYAGEREANYLNFQFAPGVGYFIQDGLEIGINSGFGLGRSKTTINDIDYITQNYDVRIGPYIKKYIPITEKLHFTARGDAGVSYHGSKYRSGLAEDNPSNPKIFSYQIVASTGLIYFATEKLGFTIDVGRVSLIRQTTKHKSTDSASSMKSVITSFGADVSPYSSFIGVRYFFQR